MALLIPMASLRLVAQTSEPAANQSKPRQGPTAVSLPHLYWHFLIYQHHLDQLAVEHEKQGKEGGWLRSYLQTKLSMTDAEFQPIRESADSLDAAMATLNAKAKAVVSAVNASRSKDGVPSAHEQHYRHQLKKLTAQREAAINTEIDRLNASLTPEAAQTLESYVKNTFSKNVSVVHVSPEQAQSRPFGTAAITGKVQP